jgi:hypothetical protein
MAGDTLDERHEKTMGRLAKITEAGYQDVVQGKWEVDKGLLAAHPELEAHPIVLHEPLNNRDALYGVRVLCSRITPRTAGMKRLPKGH